MTSAAERVREVVLEALRRLQAERIGMAEHGFFENVEHGVDEFTDDEIDAIVRAAAPEQTDWPATAAMPAAQRPRRATGVAARLPAARGVDVSAQPHMLTADEVLELVALAEANIVRMKRWAASAAHRAARGTSV